MTTIKAVIQNRRIEVSAPENLPDGTKVVLTIDSDNEDEPMSADEIIRIITAMQKVQPLDIPDDTAEELERWEKQLNQHGIDNAEKGIEDLFR